MPPSELLREAAIGALAALLAACGSRGSSDASAPHGEVGETAPVSAEQLRGERTADRRRMLENQLIPRGISDPRVLAAMARVPRHAFVPKGLRSSAYRDSPLPIGHEQTISQPYIVAFMSQSLELEGDEKVLEIGTGSGYQAAVLGELAREVYTIEIVEPLAESARRVLADLGYANVHVRAGDGYRGWPDQAPFDAIMVTAAPEHVPQPLIDQLRPGGRMILPVGGFNQDLIVIEKDDTGETTRRSVLPVRFVPMTGEARER